VSRVRHGIVLVDDGLFNTFATLEEIRLVWASVSEDPSISIRCLAQRTGIQKTRVHHILPFLERAGYIQLQLYCTGRRVRIPMIWT